ncbi:MAG: glycosyltransferase 4 family protein [Candidatus Pacearchaeota archaeon]
MEKILFLSIIASFLITFYFIPIWIKRAGKVGLTGKDINKKDKKEIPEAGGINVVFGFIFGVLVYIAIRTFYLKVDGVTIEIFALTTSILIISFIGMIDDILGWKIGLGKKARVIFVLFAAVPLMVINAGESTIYLPILGATNLGVFYALILIPLGIVGASTTFNFLAGYNGLEAGQGVLILSALAYVSFVTGTSWLALIGLCMVASLIAFLFYNKYPAKIFPGDVMTYSVGALIAIMAILGNYELFALFIFIPYILETALKIRGRLEKESFGEIQPDGSIKNKYDKIYGLEHLAIIILEKVKKSKKAYEIEVVLLIYAFQLAIIFLGFFIIL